jgi:OHCU decarboxylase
VSAQPYKNLAWLNELSPAEAGAAFLDCCGSGEWAKAMAASRPFAMLEDVFERAERIWFSLPVAEWLEAFAAHPKIGANESAATQKKRSAGWSKDEQSGVNSAETETRDALAEANRLYEQRFGFIFIVCATGKTADEMLAICRARLGNSVRTELQIAAEEQKKITEIRLTKLLER